MVIFRFSILHPQDYILKITEFSKSVCDGGFGGWGRERPVKQRVTGLGNGAEGGQHGGEKKRAGGGPARGNSWEGGISGLKNSSEKCEGRRGRRGKKPEWAMGRTRQEDLNGCIMHQVHTNIYLTS
jgi:hypothetical protein